MESSSSRIAFAHADEVPACARVLLSHGEQAVELCARVLRRELGRVGRFHRLGIAHSRLKRVGEVRHLRCEARPEPSMRLCVK